MAWTQAIPLTELKNTKRHKITLNNHNILLLWHQNDVHAIQSDCPHFKLPLAKGELTEKCTIICPFHHSEFNLNTGAVAAWAPWPKVFSKIMGKISKKKPLKIYPTKVEDDLIWVNA